MQRRYLPLVWAYSAAGLLSLYVLGASTPARSEPAEPTPDAIASETVSILDARKGGDLAVEVRGAGQDRIKMTLKNTTSRRLNVVIPPGLVASSTAAQGGRGGAFQSMGLGSVSNRIGSFGAFASIPATDSTAFRSVAINGNAAERAVAVPAGQSIDLTVVSVCLNFGVRTPNPRDKFDLVDVDQYTTDPRGRKALRSLATFGTSHGVAQAVAWRVFNDVSFEAMHDQATKIMNASEVALASRFVDALDSSSSSELVDPTYLSENRLFVRVSGDGAVATDANRLARELDGLRVLGLPVRSMAPNDVRAVAPAILLNVSLSAAANGETRGRIVVNQTDISGRWLPLGKTSFADGSAVSVLDGPGLARALDRAVASAFVTVKTAKKSPTVTTVRVENRLPLTIANIALKVGDSAGAPTVPFPGLGIAPSRAVNVPVQAPGATLDRVDLNGL